MHRSQRQSLSISTTIAELYQRHAKTLFSYLRLHLPTQEDAEDILAEVFVTAMKTSYLQERSDEEQRLWLWRVARNKVADYHRRKTRHPIFSLGEEAEETLYSEELEYTATHSEEIAELLTSVQQLNEVQQRVLYLRFVEGLRSAAIAAKLGKQDSAVRTLLARTLNKLHGIYEHTKELPYG